LQTPLRLRRHFLSSDSLPYSAPPSTLVRAPEWVSEKPYQKVAAENRLLKVLTKPRFGGRKIVVPRRVLETHVVESVRNGQENTRSGHRGRF